MNCWVREIDTNLGAQFLTIQYLFYNDTVSGTCRCRWFLKRDSWRDQLHPVYDKAEICMSCFLGYGYMKQTSKTKNVQQYFSKISTHKANRLPYTPAGLVCFKTILEILLYLCYILWVFFLLFPHQGRLVLLHFIPKSTYIQNGLADLNVPSRAAAAAD